MYVWQISGLKLLTPSIRLNSRHISATVIDTCMKRCQSKLKKDLAVLTWRDSWREKHCAYAHAHGSVLRTCTHNTVRSKWAVVEKLYIYHLETHFTLYVCVCVCVFFKIVNLCCDVPWNPCWHQTTSRFFFSSPAKSNPLIILESKKDNLSLLSLEDLWPLCVHQPCHNPLLTSLW